MRKISRCRGVSGFGAAGLWMMNLAGPGGLRNAGGGGVSRVRSAMIEMELDHATGAIRGMILAGKDEGKRLDALTRPALLELYKLCLRDDPDGGARGVPYRVDLPGGTLTITWTAENRIEMAGPAVIVAEGTTDL